MEAACSYSYHHSHTDCCEERTAQCVGIQTQRQSKRVEREEGGRKRKGKEDKTLGKALYKLTIMATARKMAPIYAAYARYLKEGK